MKKIVIIGCGWLGKQLASRLMKEHHQVFGSYRTDTSKVGLELLEIIPFEFDAEQVNFQIPEIVKINADVVILSMPPINKENLEFYGNVLVRIVEQFETNAKFIFTSSIGIYPHESGVYDENYAFNEYEKSTALYQAESKLMNACGNRLTILRLGGLIGPNRHPIKFLSGKEISNDGSCPVSLIDSRDITEFISLIIKSENFGETWNIVFPTTQSKKEYYLEISAKLKLLPPVYGKLHDINRVIIPNKSQEKLEFRYTHDIIDWN